MGCDWPCNRTSHAYRLVCTMKMETTCLVHLHMRQTTIYFFLLLKKTKNKNATMLTGGTDDQILTVI